MDETYAKAKTVVFWDIETCDVPDGIDVGSIMPNIISALSNMKYFGPISLFAYGDTTRMKKEIVDDISRTGFMLQQVIGGGEFPKPVNTVSLSVKLGFLYLVLR